MTSRADKELSELLELGDRIVAMATKGGVTVAECMLRSGAELSARVRLEQARARRGGGASLGWPSRDEGQAGRDDVDERSHRGRHRALRRATRSSSPSSRRRTRSPGPADKDLLVDADEGARPRSLRSEGRQRRRRAGDRDREASASSAARDFDPRITNSEGATFSRTAGGVALVLSSGFRGGVHGLVPVAQRRARRRRRGRQEAPRLPLDARSASSTSSRTRRRSGEEAARRTLRKLGAEVGRHVRGPGRLRSRTRRARSSACSRAASWAARSGASRATSSVARAPRSRARSSPIVDDPLIPRAPGSRPFDGEGLASRKNVVVEKGVLRTYLCDSYSARKLGARRAPATPRAAARPASSCSTTNFILQPGTDSNADIVKGTKRGLYVTEMMGFGFNAVTGDFSRGAAGFWIENGELAYPGERGHDLAQRRRALEAHRRRRLRSRSAHLHRGADASASAR